MAWPVHRISPGRNSLLSLRVRPQYPTRSNSLPSCLPVEEAAGAANASAGVAPRFMILALRYIVGHTEVIPVTIYAKSCWRNSSFVIAQRRPDHTTCFVEDSRDPSTAP